MQKFSARLLTTIRFITKIFIRPCQAHAPVCGSGLGPGFWGIFEKQGFLTLNFMRPGWQSRDSIPHCHFNQREKSLSNCFFGVLLKSNFSSLMMKSNRRNQGCINFSRNRRDLNSTKFSLLFLGRN